MWRRNKAFSRQEKLREFHYKFKQDMLRSILQVEQSKDANKAIWKYRKVYNTQVNIQSHVENSKSVIRWSVYSIRSKEKSVICYSYSNVLIHIQYKRGKWWHQKIWKGQSKRVKRVKPCVCVKASFISKQLGAVGGPQPQPSRRDHSYMYIREDISREACPVFAQFPLRVETKNVSLKMPVKSLYSNTLVSGRRTLRVNLIERISLIAKINISLRIQLIAFSHFHIFKGGTEVRFTF